MSSTSFLKHGLLEMAGYFVAGLAGGILSVAVIRHHYSTPKFRKIVIDSLWMFGAAVVIILIAGLVEVFL
jgi:uncharacterized membrane protein SpoIIM required for sporulation